MAAPEDVWASRAMGRNNAEPGHIICRWQGVRTKLFLTALMLATVPVDTSPSWAQAGATASGGIGVTSPLDAGTGVSIDNPQGSADLNLGIENPMPCSASSASPVSSTFDGGGIAALGFDTAGASASTPGNQAPATPGAANCGAQSSTSASGITTAAPTASTVSSASSSTGGATATGANASANSASAAATASLGATKLGTTGLGATALGTTALSSIATASGSMAQDKQITTVSPNGTSCPGATGAIAGGSGGASNGSGGTFDPEQSLSVSVPTPAQTLGGTTPVPAGSTPCPSSTSGATP